MNPASNITAPAVAHPGPSIVSDQANHTRRGKKRKAQTAREECFKELKESHNIINELTIENIKEKHGKEMELLNLKADMHRKAMATMDAFSKMCNAITNLVENKENIPNTITNLLK